MTFLRLWNSPGGGGDLSWFPPGVRQCGLQRLLLRTLLDVSVLMMFLDYDRIRALCGCRMIECLWRTLSRRMGEGCRPSPVRHRPCEFCGTLIRCDMYRHVAHCHLDLAQLWRCPVSWCTVWKGTPQDLMDHVRGTNNVRGEVQNAFPAMDSYTPGVHRLADVATLRYLQ